jgi:lysozyme
MPRQINEAGLAMIKSFEGLRLDAYRDPVGIWTIGYGHIRGVQPGMTITEPQATDFLR